MHISLGVTEIVEYRTEQRAERIDFTCQTDGDKDFFYALASDVKLRLNGSSDSAGEIVLEIIKQYKRWISKNDTLANSVKCEFKLFKVFLESKFKVNECYNWENFCDRTFKRSSSVTYVPME
jgi:hypothetical protein